MYRKSDERLKNSLLTVCIGQRKKKIRKMIGISVAVTAKANTVIQGSISRFVCYERTDKNARQGRPALQTVYKNFIKKLNLNRIIGDVK